MKMKKVLIVVLIFGFFLGYACRSAEEDSQELERRAGDTSEAVNTGDTPRANHAEREGDRVFLRATSQPDKLEEPNGE